METVKHKTSSYKYKSIQKINDENKYMNLLPNQCSLSDFNWWQLNNSV